PAWLQRISVHVLFAASASAPAATNAVFVSDLIAFSLVLAVDSPAVDARGTHGCEFTRDVVMHGCGGAPTRQTRQQGGFRRRSIRDGAGLPHGWRRNLYSSA